MTEAVEQREGPLAAAVARLTATSADVAPPGAVVGVSARGRIDYALTGMARRSPAEAMTWSARTDAGSVTKVVATTAALMALVDGGHVAVDDLAERYLPELAGRGISLRQLLEHRAGLWEWWPLYLSGARDADAVALAATMPPRYRPGGARHYSDLGFILLGEVVARVYGAPLREAVDRLAFERFGLRSTRFAAPAPGGPVIASSTGDAIERRMIDTGVPYPVTGRSRDFVRWRTQVLCGEVNDGNAFHAFGGVAGHAGMFTTAADLLAFADRVRDSLDGDGPVRRETARTFTTPGVDPGQALGFRVWHDELGRAIGHTGFPGVAFAVLPNERATVVMITNRLHAPGVPDAAEPRATEPMWRLARRAARDHLALCCDATANNRGRQP